MTIPIEVDRQTDEVFAGELIKKSRDLVQTLTGDYYGKDLSSPDQLKVEPVEEMLEMFNVGMIRQLPEGVRFSTEGGLVCNNGQWTYLNYIDGQKSFSVTYPDVTSERESAAINIKVFKERKVVGTIAIDFIREQGGYKYTVIRSGKAIDETADLDNRDFVGARFDDQGKIIENLLN